jgi:hypothetical protein
MAYRPLYLRGLLMDGQYRFPARPEPAAAVETERSSTEVEAKRMPAMPQKPLHGATT